MDQCFFFGRPEEAEQVLGPLLKIPGITLRNIEYVDFIDAVKEIGRHYPDGEAFKSGGRFVQQSLTQDKLENLINIIDNAPTDTSSFISVYSLGGAIKDIQSDCTAFFYRQANYIMGISSTWKIKDEARSHTQWVATGYKYIYNVSVGSFINFPYSELPNYMKAYYGENALRLQYVKQRYDPHNVFSFPQSIKNFDCV